MAQLLSLNHPALVAGRRRAAILLGPHTGVYAAWAAGDTVSHGWLPCALIVLRGRLSGPDLPREAQAQLIRRSACL